MKYRDMLGFPKKKAKKKVIPQPYKPSITEKLKEELNEWNDTTFKNLPKRWSGSGLTEFERKGGKDSINEVDFEKVKIPSQVKKWLARFVISVNGAGLNRIKSFERRFDLEKILFFNIDDPNNNNNGNGGGIGDICRELIASVLCRVPLTDIVKEMKIPQPTLYHRLESCYEKASRIII